MGLKESYLKKAYTNKEKEMDWSKRFKEKMKYVTHEDDEDEFQYCWLSEKPDRIAWLGREVTTRGEVVYELPRPKR